MQGGRSWSPQSPSHAGRPPRARARSCRPGPSSCWIRGARSLGPDATLCLAGRGDTGQQEGGCSGTSPLPARKLRAQATCPLSHLHQGALRMEGKRPWWAPSPSSQGHARALEGHPNGLCGAWEQEHGATLASHPGRAHACPGDSWPALPPSFSE